MSTPIDKIWVVNLSSKPISDTEQSLLEKGPKFAVTTNRIAEVAISNLPDEAKDAVRITTASVLHIELNVLIARTQPLMNEKH
jgi:hypothetical protein